MRIQDTKETHIDRMETVRSKLLCPLVILTDKMAINQIKE